MANDYSRSANEIASEYSRGNTSVAGYAPRTGRLQIWDDGDIARKPPTFESTEVTVEVNGTTIVARSLNGDVEVFFLKPGAYASFVYDDEG